MFTFEPVTDVNFEALTRLFGEAHDDWVVTPDPAWLAQLANSPEANAAIVRQDTNPIGYIQYDRIAKATYALALFIAKPFRGRGLGPRVLSAFIASRPASDRFVAYIEANNFLSSIAFEKAGFRISGPSPTQHGAFEYRHPGL